MHDHIERTRRPIRRRLRLAILGTTGALLIQASVVVHEGVAAGSDDARAVEAGRRSDPVAAQPARRAALKRRMDEMRERRRGHRRQRQERLRRLTPDERRQRIEPKPLPRRPRGLDDALERVDVLRGRFDGTASTVQR